MADRIADPWGERTPYPRGGDWPVRVDEHIDGSVDRWVQSACVLCSHGCALDIGVRDGRIVGVRGRERRSRQPRPARAEGPVRLAGQQLGRPAAAPARPPRRRAARGDLGRGDGRWSPSARASCSRRRAAARSASTRRGQLFLEDYYTLALVARGGIGTNHLDGNTRLCTATAGQALKETFGCDGQPGGVHDIEYCDTILHVGINTAETQTVLWMRELDRLRGPDPPRSIVIDPRETESAREADVHLAIKPGTNLAVLNGLAQQLIENDWIDREFVDAHTVGFDALEQTVVRVHAGARRGDLRRRRRRRAARRARSSARPSGCSRSSSRASTSRIRRRPSACAGEQHQPAARDDRQAGLRGSCR